jgi:hypothetical protein
LRIAHISDFHLRHHLPGNSLIGKRRGRLLPGLLADAIDQINALAPDLLAVTGDLVDYPLYGLEDPDLLSRGLDDLRLVKEIVDRATCPVAYLYGNHDHPEQFRDLFSEQPSERDIEGYRVLTFLDEEGEGHHPERVGDVRTRFEQVLSDSDNRPQVHLQHYLVWPNPATSYPHSYRDAPTLRSAIVDSRRVRLVLSGHYHVGYDLFEEDGVAFSTATAFCEPPHAYRTYDLSATGIIQRVYTLADRQRRKPAILLDHDGLLAPLSNSDEGSAALRRLSEAGYLVLGIVRQRLEVTRTVCELETSGDQLFDKLKQGGVEVDGLISRFDRKTVGEEDDAAILTEACDSMLVSQKHAHLFTLIEAEASAGRDAGIMNVYKLDSKRPVEAFCDRARAILEIAT